MHPIFLLYLLLLPFAVVGQSSAVKTLPVQTDGVSTIHLTIDRTDTLTQVGAWIYHVFPAYDFSEVHDSLSGDKQETWLRCPVRVAQEGYLGLNHQVELTVFLIPGDTIHVHVSLSGHYTISGKTQVVQQYYVSKKERFPLNPGQRAMNAGVNAPNLINFRQQVDTLEQDQIHFLVDYHSQHPLPDWFVRFETDAIRYDNAMIRLYMVWYQQDYQKKNQTLPANYFAFLNQLLIRNDQAQYDYAYMIFLREYVGWKLRSSTQKTTYETYRKIEFKLVDQLLGSDLGGFFRLWTISSGTKDNPELAQKALREYRFPAQYQYLVSYIDSRSEEKRTFLKPGDKAPAFFLTDTRDSLVSLSQFKGQAVYLCFWFAGCGGCKHEYPFENKLVEQFRGSPVQIVSICTTTPPDKWREAIRKEGLKTTNLFANVAWKKTLEEKYAISVYPHYVLIDGDGRIVENFATRPSQNPIPKINAVLAQIKEK